MASACFTRLTFFSGRIIRRLLADCRVDSSHNPRHPFTRWHVMSKRKFGSQNVLHSQANEKASVKNDMPDDTLFDEGFTTISNFLLNYTKSLALPEVSQWFEKVINYNVPHGKRIRGLAVLKTYKLLVPESSLEEKKLAVVLGWCIEVCQAYFLIMDDLMDQSLKRRGMTCWYRQEEVGLNAINDGILLESGVFQLMKGHFSNHPSYVDMVDAFHEIIYLTTVGQCLDMLSKPNGAILNLDKFTPERHADICKLKASYYSLCLPVRLALLLAEKGDSYTREVELLLHTLGHMFQVKDDFLDCFGDPALTGKVGNDIEGGKCSWPIVTAFQLVGSEDKLLLKEHYGRDNPESVEVVKNIYRKVDIPNCFEVFESETYVSVCKQIESLGQKSDIPAQVFDFLLNQVYKRRK